MKKKQFMSKLAALTMAAAMGLTMVPTTALSVMAETTTTAAEDNTASKKDDVVNAIQSKIKTITVADDTAGTNKASGLTIADTETGLKDAADAIKALDSDNASLEVSLDGVASYDTDMNQLTAKLKVDKSTDGAYDGDYDIVIDCIVTREDTAAIAAAKDAIGAIHTRTNASATQSDISYIVKEALDKKTTANGVTFKITSLTKTDDPAQFTANISLARNASTDTTTLTIPIDTIAATDDQVTVSVGTKVTMSAAEQAEIKSITRSVHNANFLVATGDDAGSYNDIFDTDHKNAVKTTAAVKVKDLLDAAYTSAADDSLATTLISGVSVTDPKTWSYTITDANGAQATVTVKTGHTYTLTSKVTDLLDEYFENTDYTLYKDQNLTSKKIANDLNADTTADYLNKQTIKDALASYGVTISGDDTLVKDGKGVVKASIAEGNTGSYQTDGKDTTEDTIGTSTIDYTFTINVDQKTDDEKTALKNAIAALNGSTYADPGDEDMLTNKIRADLIDAGAPEDMVAAVKAPKDAYKKATATADGSWYYVVDNNVLNITLKYSSASKLADTKKSIRKALVGANKGTSDTWETGNETAGYEDKEGDVYTYAANSKFSLSLQKKDATTAAKTDDIKAALEKAVTDQLTADKLTDNGVKVTNVYTSTRSMTSKAATTGEEGDTYVVISASIRNDFYGWKNDADKKVDQVPTGVDEKEKNDTYNFLVDVNTGKLKSVETTALALDDQVIELVPNVDYSPELRRFTRLLVTINPTVTPEDGNDEIVYVLKDQYGNKVTDAHQKYSVTDKNGKVQTYTDTYVDADGNEKTVADNEFLFTTDDGGKYTVEVYLKNAKDVKASAALTIKDSFNDGLDKTKYYRPAVKWAYETKISNGVDDDNFGVSQTTSRAQFVTWMYKLAEKAGADMTVTDAASKFTDVASTAYYADAVAWATQHGIVSGTSDTTFSPNEQITRGQMVTLLYRLNGSDVNITAGKDDTDATVNFTDIAGKYYTTPITWAANKDIVNGKTTTIFAPNDNATRAEAITVLYRFNETLTNPVV